MFEYKEALMRVKEVEFENEKSLIVYVTEEERKNENVIMQINEYKALYKNISIFISGDAGIESVLGRIINNR